MTIVLPDIGLICSLLNAKCIDLSLLIDYSTYFKEEPHTTIVNSVRCPLNIGFLTTEITQIRFILSVRVRLIEVFAE